MNYLSINDIDNLSKWVEDAIALKKDPLNFQNLGKNKTIGLLFFNNSLRTRLSTQKAAINIGLDPIVMNFGNEGWALEFADGTIMNEGKAEHVKEAAQVISQYCDIIAVRAFASLKDKEQDLSEEILSSFVKYASVPIVNMESSVAHPLQALADAITIKENLHLDNNSKTGRKTKVVLCWAPHPKALPHAVANSFVKMILKQDFDFVITHPKGYELDKEVIQDVKIEYDSQKAFENADFVYVKNWSSFNDYGKVICQDKNWMITKEKMKRTNKAKFMHCLPVRRNVVVTDEVLDSENSLVIEQANNRTFAAQIVLKKILEKQ